MRQYLDTKEGHFRSRFNSRANEIRLLSDRLALCPAANWSRYSLSASRAWSATNNVGGLVVTFENAAIADNPTKIASVQMELFPRTGEVALRYDLANVGDATYTAGTRGERHEPLCRSRHEHARSRISARASQRLGHAK